MCLVTRSEPIPDSRLGEDVAWTERIGFDLTPNVCNVNTQVLLRVAVRSARPDRGEKLPMRHRLPGVRHQESQKLPLDRREVNQRATTHKCAGIEIHLQIAA